MISCAGKGRLQLRSVSLTAKGKFAVQVGAHRPAMLYLHQPWRPQQPVCLTVSRSPPMPGLRMIADGSLHMMRLGWARVRAGLFHGVAHWRTWGPQTA